MTSTALEQYQPAALAIRPDQEFWDDKQRAALQALGIKEASNADLAVFMHYCQKTGLDPFSKQIYLMGRRTKENDQWVTKQTIQVGIGGLQVIRDRIAQRLGVAVEYEDSVWYDADGGEHTVWLRDEPPAACRMAVLKDGRRFPAVVRYSAYVQTTKDGKPNSMWARMGAEQLEKCAEAKALRRAFPNDLSGVYIPEEMHDDDRPVRAEASHAPRVTAAEILGTAEPAEPVDAEEWPQTALIPDGVA
jgi:phage recombination protein Bet